jgi:predicted NBD/HSP70 family sugar kinase
VKDQSEKIVNNNVLISKRLYFYETIGPRVQSVINESIILNYLKDNSPISRAKISKDLNVSAPTVSKIIDNLIKSNFVIETEKAKSSGGKRPTKLVFNKDIGFVLGIDLCKRRLIIAKTDFEVNIINKYSGFRIIHTDEDILDKIVGEIDLFLKKYNINLRNSYGNKSFAAISIAVPGNVDQITGKIISAPLFKNWLNLNLKDCLEDKFGVPVYVENIVNLSAIGENHFGEGKKFSDLVFLEVSNGVGAGIIIDNSLFRGSLSSAGEIAFMVIKPENLHFKYKIKGNLEKEISIENIERKVIEDIKKGERTKITDFIKDDFSEVDFSMICRAAKYEDKYAKSVINKIVDDISIVVINLILVLNPQIVVIGGQICAAPYINDLIVKPIKNIVRNIVPFKMPGIILSKPGENAAILGASFMAVDSIMTGRFPYKIR